MITDPDFEFESTWEDFKSRWALLKAELSSGRAQHRVVTLTSAGELLDAVTDLGLDNDHLAFMDDRTWVVLTDDTTNAEAEHVRAVFGLQHDWVAYPDPAGWTLYLL
jgi:hypothetical protein